MAYDEHLSDRIENILNSSKIIFEPKKMFGGICYMVDNKMCIGVHEETLMARVGPDAYEDALKKKGASEMLFTGRAMKGFVFIKDEGIDTDKQLMYWVELCLLFNPLAKSSKKKKKK